MKFRAFVKWLGLSDTSAVEEFIIRQLALDALFQV